jgi:hypothetical protein
MTELPERKQNTKFNQSYKNHIILTMKNLITITLLTIAATFGASAEKAPYTLDVKDFIELQVVDPINVIHRSNADSAGMVTFVADKATASKILFSNNKNKLKIEVDTAEGPIAERPTITVYSSFLSRVENDADSTVTVIAPTPGSMFKASVVGNGRVVVTDIHATETQGKISTGKGSLKLSGITNTVKLNNTGTGSIDAIGLKADTGKCSVVGTGPIDCTVTKELTILGLGTGTVTVYGNPPTVKNRTIGVKSVIKE